jgi:hypothetical protein
VADDQLGGSCDDPEIGIDRSLLSPIIPEKDRQDISWEKLMDIPALNKP